MQKFTIIQFTNILFLSSIRSGIMGKVLIVEDDQIVRHELVKTVKSIGSGIEIFETGYAREALTMCKEHYINVFFLDIRLLDYSGIKLAKQIRDLDKYHFTPIIFITAVPSKELEAFRTVHCYDYIIKPFTKNEVNKVFKKAIYHSVKKEKGTIKLKQKGFIHEIDLKDIIFIEVKYKKIYITTANEILTYTSYTLTKIMEMLSDDFIRCHKSYIVNKKYIEKINKRDHQIKLKEIGNVIPYGRQYQDLLRGEWE